MSKSFQQTLEWFRYRCIVILLLCAKSILDGLTLLSVLVFPGFSREKTSRIYPCAVYMSVHSGHFFDSIRCLLSFERYFPGIHIIVIDDGSLKNIHLWLYSKLPIKVDVVSHSAMKQIITSMKRFPYIEEFIQHSWCGKKFIFPLMEKRYKKIILLDADMLFFREPKELAMWMRSSSKSHLYMRDYMNFSDISPIEAANILGTKPSFTYLNSGLLCINLEEYWSKNSLKKINSYIKSCLEIVKSRMTYDRGNSSDFAYTPHLLEQTMFWLTLVSGSVRSLGKNYFILPFHKNLGKAIGDPVVIHYTGSIDLVNIALYKYLTVSLFYWVKALVSAKRIDDRYWFVYSKIYCYKCRHPIKV